ncbi:polysaccharide deacetylase family protein [Rhizobium sp. BR 314]|uniref:polysaccharide deacetylase family protein n=1 Tax=Rhizobium sp. BR 314 TaxID=3040013 RepID=UPI0039BF7EF8
MPIPILRYSQIADPTEQSALLRSQTVYPSNFRIQMRRLKSLGFTGLSLRDLKPYLYGEKSGPVFGITFDNGFHSIHVNVLETLQELRFTATGYFVANQVGGSSISRPTHVGPRERYMSRVEMLEWALMGHEVGAHSLDHVRLTEASPMEARRHITSGRYELEDILGNSVDSFSYPYGDVSKYIRTIVEEAGYVSAATTFSGRVLPGDDMLRLPRQTVEYADSWLSVLCKCAIG